MWMNIKQSAKYAGTTRQTFAKWLEDGLKHHRVGGLIRIKDEDIDDYIEKHPGGGMDEVEDAVRRALGR